MSLTVFWVKIILSEVGSGMWCERSESVKCLIQSLWPKIGLQNQVDICHNSFCDFAILDKIITLPAFMIMREN